MQKAEREDPGQVGVYLNRYSSVLGWGSNLLIQLEDTMKALRAYTRWAANGKLL